MAKTRSNGGKMFGTADAQTSTAPDHHSRAREAHAMTATRKSTASEPADKGNPISPAFDAVCAAEHPTPKDGGPCATCAFRLGTQANQSAYTTMLAQLCVEGITPFDCHERPQLCRGWIAAVNLRGVPESSEDRRHMEASRLAAEILADAIEVGAAADRAANADPKAVQP